MTQVFDKLKKITLHVMVQTVLLFSVGTVSAFAYRVSGIVEFSYRDYETKIGSTRISNRYWTQLYRADLQSHLLDPRVLQYTAGVGYNVITRYQATDSTILDYNLYTSFFPTMKISWDLSGSKSTRSVESSQSLAGYDVETTTYGGTMRFRPSLRNGNRNNNSGDGPGNWPTVTLSYLKTASESMNIASPLDEEREDTRATLFYQTNSSFSLSLDGGLEKYENLLTGGTYDLKTGSLDSYLRVAPNSDLRITGRVDDRRTDNLTLANAQTRDSTYEAQATLDFKEREGFQHYYRYTYNDRTLDTTKATLHSGDARFLHRLSPDLRLEEGLEYRFKQYARESSGTPTDPGVDAIDESGGVVAGVLYGRELTPAFPGPLVVNAGYTFGTGFSDQQNKTTGEAGNGWYYRNNVNLSFGSSKWENENLSLTYSYSGQEDSSPINNDYWQHNYQFLVITRRIPRTILRGSAGYVTLENTVERGIPLLSIGQSTQNQAGTNLRRRAVNYEISADYNFPEYVTLSAGASRGKSDSTTFTLSTLPVASLDDNKLYYGQARLVYPITRRLVFRAVLREEFLDALGDDRQSHQAELYLDFRFRQLFLNFEYRVRQDIPDIALRTTQQYAFAKISRPF